MKGINQQQPDKKIQYENEMFTFEEACLYLKVSKSFLYKSTSDRTIPFYKPTGGKILRFKREDLDHWLTQNRYPSKNEFFISNQK
jgi:excisionase family DNA binding protein